MKHTDILKVGIIQQTCSADVEANKQKLARNIADVAEHGAQLVVLQELHNSPYFCQVESVDNFDLAEPIPGPSTEFFGALAKKHHVVLVTSLFERRAAGIYHNTAVVFEADGTIAGKYRKMHIPDDPAYYEKFYFTPGDLGFHPIDTSVGRLGVQVCWDQWYPEGARLMALSGAKLLIYPTAIGYESSDHPEEQERQREAWTTVQRGHAVANGLPVIAVNRTGHEDDPSHLTRGIQFWGSSFVAGPQGEMLYRAPKDEEVNVVVDVDMRRSDNVRRWWPFLRDRRIEFFEGLTHRYLVDLFSLHKSWEEEAVGNTLLRRHLNHGVKHISRTGHTEAHIARALQHERGRLNEIFRSLLHRDTSEESHHAFLTLRVGFALCDHLLHLVGERINGVVHSDTLSWILVVVFNHRASRQFRNTHDAIGMIHTVFLNTVNRWVDITSRAVEVSGMHVNHKRFSAHVFGVNASRISQPVVCVNDVIFLLTSYHASHDGIVVNFVEEIIGVASRKLDTSQIVRHTV